MFAQKDRLGLGGAAPALAADDPRAYAPAMVCRWVLLPLLALAACSSPDPLPGGGDGGSSSTGGGSEATGSSAQSTGAAEGSAEGGSDESGDTTGSTSDASSSSGSTTGMPIVCEPVPSCDVALPDPGPTVDWERLESSAVVLSGGPRHRGRDMFYNPDDVHWAMAKFAYGPTDWDLSGERIDAYLLRNCEGDWQLLGSALTTFDGDHATVEGVEDSGGWVFLQMPQALPLGRHRIHWVVRGDDTRADTYIEVVDPGTPVILSDVDGTLTTGEWERLVDYLLSTIPDVNEGAPEALTALVELGYRPMYLTARPEFLGRRTYQFIEERGLPPGIIHTSLSATGALGSAAVELKSGELAALAQRGLVPSWVFGNSSSDAEAYENAGIQPVEQRVFFQYEDTAFGGRTIQSYTELVPEFEGLDPVCE